MAALSLGKGEPRTTLHEQQVVAHTHVGGQADRTGWSPHGGCSHHLTRHRAAAASPCLQDFLKCVAVGRGMPLEEVRQLAKGRVYTGRQALEVRGAALLG